MNWELGGHKPRIKYEPEGPSFMLLRPLSLTLLFEYISFTPLPDALCMMVLYSPSSSSLRSNTEVEGDNGVGFGSVVEVVGIVMCS